MDEFGIHVNIVLSNDMALDNNGINTIVSIDGSYVIIIDFTNLI